MLTKYVFMDSIGADYEVLEIQDKAGTLLFRY